MTPPQDETFVNPLFAATQRQLLLCLAMNLVVSPTHSDSRLKQNHGLQSILFTECNMFMRDVYLGIVWTVWRGAWAVASASSEYFYVYIAQQFIKLISFNLKLLLCHY